MLWRPKHIQLRDIKVEKPVATVFPRLFRNESNCRDDGKNRPLVTRGDGGPPSYAIVMYYYYLLVCWNCFGDFLNVFFVKRIYISQQRCEAVKKNQMPKNDRIEAAFFHAGYVSGMLRGFFFRARKSWEKLGGSAPI